MEESKSSSAKVQFRVCACGKFGISEYGKTWRRFREQHLTGSGWRCWPGLHTMHHYINFLLVISWDLDVYLLKWWRCSNCEGLLGQLPPKRDLAHPLQFSLMFSRTHQEVVNVGDESTDHLYLLCQCKIHVSLWLRMRIHDRLCGPVLALFSRRVHFPPTTKLLLLDMHDSNLYTIPFIMITIYYFRFLARSEQHNSASMVLDVCRIIVCRWYLRCL